MNERCLEPTLNSRLNELIFLIQNERPQKSDAIVWLQGDSFDRGPKVVELFKKSWASKIFVTGNNDLVGPGKRPDENNASLEEMKDWLNEQGIKEENFIIDNKAFNTRDQALNTIQLAKREGWNKIIIVGSHPYYQFRVFLTFLKAAQELQWGGKIINQPALIPEDSVPGGREKTVRELVLGEEAKLEKYKDHIVSIEEGMRYLLLNKEELFFRKAVRKDAELLLQWRNDTVVMDLSFNQHIINLDEHKLWLEKVFKDPFRHLYIILNSEKKAIGTVRFDEEGEGAEINITLTEEFRGKGYGSQAIWQASRFFLASHPQINQIIARIKEANEASIRSFAKAGFKEHKKDEGIIYLAIDRL